MKSKILPIMLALVAGCDFFSHRDLSREREDAAYKTAMEDYRSGRIRQALVGFEKAVRDNPANTSARFQLACLLQDDRRDYVGAYCSYHEFLQQFPESDKAKLAKDRMAKCEKEIAKSLSSRYGYDSAIVAKKECETIRQELKLAQERNAKLDNDFAEAMRRIATLRRENERLVAAMKGSSASDVAAPAVVAVDAKALIDKDDESQPDRIKMSADVERLRSEKEDDPDRSKLSSDIAQLRREGEQEAAEAASMLPAQPADAKQQRAAREEAAAKAKEAERQARKRLEPPHEKRPAFYIVEEGDTLIRIAIRFYGKPSAWKKLREANKAVVSTDGRVQAGDKIVFPDPEK